jgi:hypothetical protein
MKDYLILQFENRKITPIIQKYYRNNYNNHNINNDIVELFVDLFIYLLLFFFSHFLASISTLCRKSRQKAGKSTLKLIPTIIIE